MNNVIDIYFENSRHYLDDNEEQPYQISRSVFERELTKSLLQCKLEFEPKMALLHAILTGEQFDRWWSDTKRSLNLDEAQTERYKVDQTLCRNPLSLSIASDSDSSDGANSSTEYHDEDTIRADQDVKVEPSSPGAATPPLYHDETTIGTGPDVNADPSSPDAATEYVANYGDVSRPRRRRRPLKEYGPEIERIEKAQAKEDGAYDPRKGLKVKRGGRSGGGPSTYKRNMDIVDRSLAKFDAQRRIKAEAEDGDDEVMADT